MQSARPVLLKGNARKCLPLHAGHAYASLKNKVSEGKENRIYKTRITDICWEMIID